MKGWGDECKKGLNVHFRSVFKSLKIYNNILEEKSNNYTSFYSIFWCHEHESAIFTGFEPVEMLNSEFKIKLLPDIYNLTWNL